MLYVIVRNEDGWFVTPPGSRGSYTPNLAFARTFLSEDYAWPECCGNEHVAPVEGLLMVPSCK